MKKFLILVTLFVVALALVIPQIVLAKEDVDKGPLTKIVLIHYKKPNVKPDGTPGKPPKDGLSGYTYLAKGAKWKVTEGYVLGPGAAPSGALNAIQAAMNTWDVEVSFAIFGGLTEDPAARVDLSKVDGSNVIVFDRLDDANIIAISYVWGHFSGSPDNRDIVEVDMIFNTFFTWGNASSGNAVMDVQNIATHELGHAAGLGDLYSVSLELETMYGYSGYGETIKRYLYDGAEPASKTCTNSPVSLASG